MGAKRRQRGWRTKEPPKGRETGTSHSGSGDEVAASSDVTSDTFCLADRMGKLGAHVARHPEDAHAQARLDEFKRKLPEGPDGEQRLGPQECNGRDAEMEKEIPREENGENLKCGPVRHELPTGVAPGSTMDLGEPPQDANGKHLTCGPVRQELPTGVAPGPATDLREPPQEVNEAEERLEAERATVAKFAATTLMLVTWGKQEMDAGPGIGTETRASLQAAMAGILEVDWSKKPGGAAVSDAAQQVQLLLERGGGAA
jgi:hypothetical protein